MSIAKTEGSARDRLLAAANELFYEEGVHTVGIDRVIEKAGVAKASLYSTFGSKDALVQAYLGGRADARRRRIADRVERFTEPRARLEALFDLLSESARDPKFRGCAFVKIASEGPRVRGMAEEICVGSRAFTRGLLIEMAREAGAPDPEDLGWQFAMLYDGAMIAASLERDLDAPPRAKAAALALLDAALKPVEKLAKARRARA